MRVLLRFYLWLLLVASAGLAGLYGATTYARLVAVVAAPTVEGPGAATVPGPGRLLALRWLLSGTALGVGVALVLLRPRRRPGHARRAGPGLWRWLGRELVAGWRALGVAEQVAALLLLAAVTAARLYYAVAYPLSLDELASYDYSVLPGAAVTAGYYPFPNNHLLPNLLAGLVHQVLPMASPGLVLRLLPTLAGLLSLPLLYAGASRAVGFRVATLALGLFWLSPLGVYYAVAGRGYAWTLLALAGGLAATWQLLRPGRLRPRPRQAAWAMLGLSSALGLYAVPAHLYAVLALGLSLLLGIGRQPLRQRQANWRRLALTAGGSAALTLVLYAPVLAVSGPVALLHNPYVAQLPAGEFGRSIGYWLLGTAAELLGQRGVSAAAYLLLLALAPLVLWRGQLPEPARRLGWLLLAQYGLWLPLVLAQRVLPPARTLLPVLLAFFGLAALLTRTALAWSRPPGRVGESTRPYSRLFSSRLLSLVAIGLLLAGYGSYRLHREQRIVRQQQALQTELRRLSLWLHQQPGLRRVWVEPRAYALWLRHYDLTTPGQPVLPLQVVDDALATLPGPAGEVEVVRAAPAPPRPNQPVRYASNAVAVLPVGPGQPRVVLP